MTGGEVSGGAAERARKNLTLILQRLSSVGQATVATGLSLSEATVSRFKAEQAEQFSKILAILGLKVVPEHVRCYEPKQIEAVLALAKALLAQIESADQLVWEDE